MATQKETTPVNRASECRLFEILQYACELQGQGYRCTPFPRIFKMCPGRPAVEITKFVEIDPKTGEVDIESNPNLPKGRPWREIIRYHLPEYDD